MKIFKYLLIIILVIVQFSCKKIEQLPPEPYIEFISFTVFDTLDILGNQDKAGRLKIYFEDGDGDLGLKEIGSNTDTTNLFLTLFHKTDGIMIESNSTNDPLLPYSSFRIPYMERTGQNKILKGTISVTLLYQTFSPEDTVRYDIYIVDRAKNESNTISTSEINFSSNNTYTEMTVKP